MEASSEAGCVDRRPGQTQRSRDKVRTIVELEGPVVVVARLGGFSQPDQRWRESPAFVGFQSVQDPTAVPRFLARQPPPGRQVFARPSYLISEACRRGDQIVLQRRTHEPSDDEAPLDEFARRLVVLSTVDIL